MKDKIRRWLMLPGKTLAFFKRYGLRATLINADNRTFRLRSRLGRYARPRFLQEPIADRYYKEVYRVQAETASGTIRPDYVPSSDVDLSAVEKPAKLIAFYLPQFHPFPENDLWWGRGFTEWTNVSKAVPQFAGHYQPHLPGELGFYDLRVPEVQDRQVELARKYGLFGFCFYYYWFHGKRLLERPLDMFLSNPRIDFPFCLCWANENWTRRWDGQESDILIAQEHSAESDFAFIKDITSYLKHPNYIRIDGRPVLIVYRANILPEPAKTAARWRRYCVDNGMQEPYLIAAQTFNFRDPRDAGFDAAVQFPPHGIVIPETTSQFNLLSSNFGGIIYDFRQAAEYEMERPQPDYRLFRTVMPAWDNTARKGNMAHIFAHSSPQIYGAWLRHAIEFTRETSLPSENIVFINAWNEWAEGTHLEPDRRYGYAHLEKTAEVLQSLRSSSEAEAPSPLAARRHDTAVILHAFHPELLDEIDSYLANLNDNYDLHISFPVEGRLNATELLQRYPQAVLYPCENRGRDIAPFLRVFAAIYPLGYTSVCKIHTKRSAHREDGEEWRRDILDKLLGSPQTIAAAKKKMRSHRVGMLAPGGHRLSGSMYMGLNEEHLMRLASAAGLNYGEAPEFDFAAGSMFWFKPGVFKALLLMGLRSEDFEEEIGLKDGTLAHAFERFFGFLVQKEGYRIEDIGKGSAAGYKYAAPQPRNYRSEVSRQPVLVFHHGGEAARSLAEALQHAYREISLNVFVQHYDPSEDFMSAQRNGNSAELPSRLKKLMDQYPTRWNVIHFVEEPIAYNLSILPQPADSPARHGRLAFEDWVVEQFRSRFGVDVFGSLFPTEMGYKIYESSAAARLLILRQEDAERIGAQALCDLLGFAHFEMPPASAERPFHGQSPSAETVEDMIKSRFARTFYTVRELQSHAARWMNSSKPGSIPGDSSSLS